MKKLARSLEQLADRDYCVFASSDLAGAVPECRDLRILLSRATKADLLRRVCRGIYFYPVRDYPAGHLLYHAAARLRASEFNYLSLETVLSDAGVISQVPMNWISLMTSGRSHVVDCGDYGHIEFVHNAQRPAHIAADLVYDTDRRLWRASVRQALRDMKATRRSKDLSTRPACREDFRREMRRFLPASIARDTVEKDDYLELPYRGRRGRGPQGSRRFAATGMIRGPAHAIASGRHDFKNQKIMKTWTDPFGFLTPPDGFQKQPPPKDSRRKKSWQSGLESYA
jgi:hypothetical protein